MDHASDGIHFIVYKLLNLHCSFVIQLFLICFLFLYFSVDKAYMSALATSGVTLQLQQYACVQCLLSAYTYFSSAQVYTHARQQVSSAQRNYWQQVTGRSLMQTWNDVGASNDYVRSGHWWHCPSGAQTVFLTKLAQSPQHAHRTLYNNRTVCQTALVEVKQLCSRTRGSAIAEEPRDALRQLKYYGRFLTELLTRSSANPEEPCEHTVI